MGVDASSIATVTREEEQTTDGILILAPNHTVFDLFSACGRQWESVMSPVGQLIRTGLRLPDVETRARYMPSIRALSEQDQDQLWRDLITMQNAALAMFAEMIESNGQ